MPAMKSSGNKLPMHYKVRLKWAVITYQHRMFTVKFEHKTCKFGGVSNEKSIYFSFRLVWHWRNSGCTSLW
ncbi:Uncharacterised protein [Vibrio cholerae]|nr:Uncharacterised protein [Vibrio cholerae]